jgi:hypothetical protein
MKQSGTLVAAERLLCDPLRLGDFALKIAQFE